MHLIPMPAGTPEDPYRFLPLLVVLVLAFLVPLLLSRFRGVPVVVGEIIVGVIFGPSLLGWITEGPILTFMSDVGLAFLMFLAGMEIEFDQIFKRRPARSDSPNILATSSLLYIATLGTAALGVLSLRSIGLEGDPWLLVMVISATSLGVLLPILKEKDLLSSPFGQVVFLTAMLADFITVILLTVYLIVLDKGFDPQVFALGLLFVTFLIFYRVGPRLVRRPLVVNLIERLSKATVQIKVRGAVAILIAFVVLAEFVDAELILGAFLAGMIISLLKRPEDKGLIHNLEAFGFGFFIPVFFIMVGVDLNIQALLAAPETLVILPGFFLIALLVKVLPMILTKKFLSWRDLFAGGLLLNTHLSLEVAVAVIGLRAGLFNEATSTIIILFAVLTVLSMPLLFNAIAPIAPTKEPPYILLLGASETAIQVAEQLRAHNDLVKFIPLNEDEATLLKEKEFASLALTMDELNMLPHGQIQSVLILYNETHRNLEIARKAHESCLENIIVQVRDPHHLRDFDELDVKTFSPALQRATMISMMARSPNILDLLTTTTDERMSSEVTLCNPEIAGKNLRELKLPGDLLVLAIRRKEQLIIPHGGTAFELEDQVSMIGSIDDIQAVKAQFEERCL